MFRDPYVLEKAERTELIEELTYLVAMRPDLAELRVLLGMTLCVNNDPQAALEVLRTSVKTAPDNFLAQLKFGELLMRLRICDQAAEHTRQAALLAANPVQSELARRQAATIRTMRREGIERGGYDGILSRVAGLLRKRRTEEHSRAITTVSLR
jgi:predicted Zn-dependent protease